MTADHSPPGWWPQRRRRGWLEDCFSTVLLAVAALVAAIVAGRRW